VVNVELSAKERKRLKYATLREQKKHKSLMIIDNAPIRSREIRSAQGWLKKIDRLDDKIEQFHQTDRRLFGEWHDLTFRELASEIAKKREEYFAYADFHNQMILLAKTQKISIPKAFSILYGEELEFKNGDAETRAKIEERRRVRKDELERELRKASEAAAECDCPACRAERKEQADSDVDEKDFFDNEDEVDLGLRRKVEYFENLTPEKIQKLMRQSHESAMMFLLEAIPIVMQAGREDLARRFWNLTSPGVKREFNQLTKKSLGVTFDEMLADFEDGIDEFDDEDFDEDLRPTRRARHQTESLSEDDKLRLKAIYRKIVRKIHPDQLSDQFLKVRKPWIDSVWKKSVRANDLKDLDTLTKLYHQILFVFEEFDSLSVAELRSTVTSVQDEFREREAEAKRIKASPAWNFSQLKNYSKLKIRMAKPFHKELSEVSKELEELKASRAHLEQLLRSGFDLDRPRNKKRAKKRNPRRRSARRSSKSEDHSQTSFGF